LTSLKNEFDQFKAFIGNEIHLLKNQNKIILNKIETFADRIKSVKDIKKELRVLFSINGYSEALGTNSLFKKVFWFVTFSALFASCMVLVARNVDGYQANDVVTQFKVIDDQSMIFPAVTLCITDLNSYNWSYTSKNLNSKLINCTFESQSCNESIYFRPVQLSVKDQKLDCYSFNSGKNNFLLSQTRIGMGSGLSFMFNLTKFEKLLFKIHDNNEKPTFAELNDVVEQDYGKFITIEMKKTIETKEPFPYSNCTQNINSDTSHLVNQILQQNITYRQRDCYELCYASYLNTSSILGKFDYKGNCSNPCPLECTSTTFQIIKNEMNTNSEHSRLIFYYPNWEYTQILQSVKVTGADFISNTGGVLGLFLELSFFSFYRLIIFLFDVIFV